MLEVRERESLDSVEAAFMSAAKAQWCSHLLALLALSLPMLLSAWMP